MKYGIENVITNDDGYITSCGLFEINPNYSYECVIVDIPDLDYFLNHLEAYKLRYVEESNEYILVHDENRDENAETDNLINELRERRETECFTIVNRGGLWYARLTFEQERELNKWYDDWLNVTETLEPPVKPEWLN